jgi:hypothetical protein
MKHNPLNRIKRFAAENGGQIIQTPNRGPFFYLPSDWQRFNLGIFLNNKERANVSTIKSEKFQRYFTRIFYALKMQKDEGLEFTKFNEQIAAKKADTENDGEMIANIVSSVTRSEEVTALALFEYAIRNNKVTTPFVSMSGLAQSEIFCDDSGDLRIIIPTQPAEWDRDSDKILAKTAEIFETGQFGQETEPGLRKMILGVMTFLISIAVSGLMSQIDAVVQRPWITNAFLYFAFFFALSRFQVSKPALLYASVGWLIFLTVFVSGFSMGAVILLLGIWVPSYFIADRFR